MKNKHIPVQFCLLTTMLLQAFSSGEQLVTRISAGGTHSLFLKSDGSLWGMGDNSSGELGDGTTISTNRPELILTSNVTAIAAGQSLSMFLKNDGSLWAMGINSDGLFGDGQIDNTVNPPGKIVSSNVIAIAVGAFHSLFLKSDGSLWGAGDNGAGQLGDGAILGFGTLVTNPEEIVASNVTAIAAGYDYSLFLKRGGSLWGMGGNNVGQLGDGTYSNKNLPEEIIASNVTAIVAGYQHSLFLKSDGSLWAMGGNNAGQLGNGTTNNVNVPEQIVTSNVVAIAAGAFHSLFLKSNGSLWGMGDNSAGELGDGTYQNKNLPEEIVASNVIAIASGPFAFHSLLVKSDGSLWAMGGNYYGQLGDGTFGNPSTYYSTNRPEEIVIGSPRYNQISIQVLNSDRVSLSFVGIPGTNYALDRSFNLSPPIWVPQATNQADAGGVLVFTNSPDATTNNFWRIRSVP